MLIVSPLVSLVDSTKQAVDSLGIRSEAWHNVTPEDFLHGHQASPVVVSICSPEHLLSPAWRNVLTDMWTPDFVTWDEAQCSVHWNFRAYTSDVCDWFRSTFTSCKNLYSSATLGKYINFYITKYKLIFSMKTISIQSQIYISLITNKPRRLKGKQ